MEGLINKMKNIHRDPSLSPRGLAPGTANKTSPKSHIPGGLLPGHGRMRSGPRSHRGGAASPSLLLNKRFTLPFLALLAVLTAGLLFLMPGGLLQAQDDMTTLKYAEKGTDPVATFTAPDPEGARAIVWSLLPATAPTDGSRAFPIDVNGNGERDDDVDIAMADAADAGRFEISKDGVLSFKSSPNYEAAADAGTNNEYKVVVRASDGGETYAYHKVTVMVTNVEEPGTVMLSALQPQVGITLTATHSDPDGGVTSLTWKWERSAAMDGPWTTIPGDHGMAATSTYTPTGADEDKYLQATASYADEHQSGKMAMATTAMMVRTTPQQNAHPAFPDQDSGTTGIQTAQTRTVPEKTPSGTNIGAPVKANDGDNDTLTYSLGGTDEASFSINPATGQLMTKAALNFEVDEADARTFEVTVTATDPSGEAGDNATSAVTITVTNVDEAPTITDGSDANAHDFNENLKDDDATTEANEALIQAFMATDPEDITTADPDRVMTWTTAGPDGSLFSITAVAITTQGNPQAADLEFKKAPDYEMPADANKDNVYEVTVVVTDSDGMTAMRYVTVKVMNENEAGEVILSSQQPKVGVDFTASLDDDDGGEAGLKWKWYRSTDGTAGTPATCDGNTTFPNVEADPDPAIKDDNGDLIRSDTYTPNLDDDASQCLRAIASYSDGEGEMKSATGTSANPVVKDTDNKAPKFKTETTTMMVDENVSVNTLVGMVEADDKTAGVDDELTYSLGGTNAASFKVHNGDDPDTTDVTEVNGEIRVGSETKLNHETKSSYMVTVTATDPSGLTDSIDVTIMVNDVDETPELMARNKKEQYAEKGTDPVATFTAPDPEGARAIVWSLLPATAPTDGSRAFPIDVNGNGERDDDVDIAMADAADAGRFEISKDGVLSFKSSPNYEAAADAGTNNEYKVVVRASDGGETYAYHKVTVMVTNEEEPGTVMLSALQPQGDGLATDTPRTGVQLTATHSDPDGGVTSRTWKWERSRSRSSGFINIAGAHGTAATSNYTPIGADVGYYLRATASYTDAEGPNKTAMMVTRYVVEAKPDNNAHPAFPDQDPGTTGIQTAQTRTVPEKTPSGTNIGAPVKANDGDNDTLTYSLGGTDEASFSINPATGQLMTKAALNFEVDEADARTFEVTVTATDPSGEAGDNATSAVTITVTNVDEAPMITDGSDANAHDFNENLKDDDATTEANEALIQAFMATDPEDITTADPDRVMTWTTAGPDGSLFSITAVAITTQGNPQAADLEFKKAPDYEMPADANKDNVYEVTVVVTDSDGMTAMRYVTVKVMNENEAGEVILSSQQPKVGVDFTASLDDDDGGEAGLKWKWYRSTDGTAGTPATCDGNTTFPNVEADPDPAIKDDNGDLIRSDTYTPNLDDDASQCLRAIASYSDGEGEMKSATGTSANPVVKDTDNKAPKFKTETTTMMVDENVSVNTLVGMVEADDKTAGVDDELTYSLGGTNAASFKVHNGDDPDTTDVTEVNGEIRVGSETKLNHETKSSYMVTVTATDPSGLTDSIDVTIMVNDVDETPEIMRAPDANVAPKFASATTSRTVAENTAAGEDIGNPVAANDANGDTLAYTLGGTDTASFDIDGGTGQITVGAGTTLDFEATQGTYMVMVTATDPDSESAMVTVTITVTNVDEDGTVTLSSTAPAVGTEIVATLEDDPDGGVTGTTWQWASSPDMTAWTDIPGAISASYTPVDPDDVGMYLRAMAMYADGHGTGKDATEMTASVVVAEAQPMTLLERYDTAPKDGKISKDEARVAVLHFFDGMITKEQAREVVLLYFDGLS